MVKPTLKIRIAPSYVALSLYQKTTTAQALEPDALAQAPVLIHWIRLTQAQANALQAVV